ncbi:NAD(P)H-dependent glycerol-3-phosphate dehydrogenase [Ahrensia sp. 13_GOM-1096m]|uniref:NAD(P)H-dependent glycerol-3-phosphate dehydrogenase n=1 Tax=Ahrensia sp. 13_GOM-1096m TaxID=1380380 RepID=UPI0004789318|nr:NAD(P)H-dependent glycerol-3-phosphate dehydrogenase [Ahrensia sp. 13_GOM-1096m]
MSNKITVLGSGAWGTALASNQAANGKTVTLWGRDPAQMQLMRESGRNDKYLSGVQLSTNLTFSDDLLESISGADIILLVTPAQTLADTAQKIAESIGSGTVIISCAKGINQNTGETMGQILHRIFPNHQVATLSGPSFAIDVASNLPTAVTIAADETKTALALCAALSNKNLRCYASNDQMGVDYGGALKNVLAIAAGIVHGRSLGASALAALTTRGFAELQRVALALGAQAETLSGLSGFGDLVLTSSSEKSRNFAYGAAIGRGEDLTHMKLAEGVKTAQIAASIAQNNNIDAPLIFAVNELLSGSINVDEAIAQLMARPLKSEAVIKPA